LWANIYFIAPSRFVIANDLSASATAAMKRNVELNGLGPSSPDPAASTSSSVVSEHKPLPDRGKVRINEGDAW
jgi:tRNA (guanine26-N2/guanine27-N2)-dimethyltransferase